MLRATHNGTLSDIQWIAHETKDAEGCEIVVPSPLRLIGESSSPMIADPENIFGDRALWMTLPPASGQCWLMTATVGDAGSGFNGFPNGNLPPEQNAEFSGGTVIAQWIQCED